MKVSKFAVGATLKWCLRSALTPKFYSFHSVAASDVPVFRAYPGYWLSFSSSAEEIRLFCVAECYKSTGYDIWSFRTILYANRSYIM